MGDDFTPIVLTGEVLEKAELEIGQLEVLRGDVKVYDRLDSAGRAAVAGRNANYGFSGYFRGSVFDGRRWRVLKIWEFVPAENREYPTQAAKPSVLARLRGQIKSLTGQRVLWRDRAYHLDKGESESPAGR